MPATVHTIPLSWMTLKQGQSHPAHVLGEMIFTSFSMDNGVLPYWQLNMERLWQGLEWLSGGRSGLNKREFQTECEEMIKQALPLVEANEVYCRISFFPLSHDRGIGALINGWQGVLELRKQQVPRMEQPLKIGLVEIERRPWHEFKNIKISNYILESALKRANTQWDDIAFVDSNGQILEATSSNVLWSMAGNFFITPESQLLIEGITQKMLPQILSTSKVKLESKCLGKNLLQSQSGKISMWLMNQVRGFNPVTMIGPWKLAFDEKQNQNLAELWSEHRREHGKKIT